MYFRRACDWLITGSIDIPQICQWDRAYLLFFIILCLRNELRQFLSTVIFSSTYFVAGWFRHCWVHWEFLIVSRLSLTCLIFFQFWCTLGACLCFQAACWIKMGFSGLFIWVFPRNCREVRIALLASDTSEFAVTGHAWSLISPNFNILWSYIWNFCDKICPKSPLVYLGKNVIRGGSRKNWGGVHRFKGTYNISVFV